MALWAPLPADDRALSRRQCQASAEARLSSITREDTLSADVSCLRTWETDCSRAAGDDSYLDSVLFVEWNARIA